MMKRIVSAGIFFLIGFSFLVFGCFGRTKPAIPEAMPDIIEGTTRIVVTREFQVSGAAASIDVIDFGERPFCIALLDPSNTAATLILRPVKEEFFGTNNPELGLKCSQESTQTPNDNSRYRHAPPALESTFRDGMLRSLNQMGQKGNFIDVGTLKLGDTIIWERTPGKMRLSALRNYGLEPLSKAFNVEAGKTYFFHYTIRIVGDRWELTKIE